MMTVRREQPNILLRSAKCRYEVSPEYPNLRIHRPAKRNLRDLIKKTNITSMNRVFSGVAFQNDNGGLEFFSEQFKEQRMSGTLSYLSELREQKVFTEHEIIALQKVIERQEEEHDEWQAIYVRLQEELNQVHVSSENLVNQGKQGLISSNDSVRMRMQLRKDRNRVTKQLEEVKDKLDGHYKNQYRLSFLNTVLDEVCEKIVFKEQELSAAHTFTVGEPGLITVPFIAEMKNKKCCLFMDMYDFLAYDFASNYEYARDLPRLCDNIILNDPRNFMTMYMNIDTYDHIYCFFPNNLSGVLLASAIKGRKDGCVQNLSDYYKGYVSMYEYVLTCEEFEPITTDK